MKVLHIQSSFQNKSRWKQLFYYPLRQQFDFWGTPGFFYASFYEYFNNVDRRSAEWVLENYGHVNRNYKFVLCDLRLDTSFSNLDLNDIHRKLVETVSIPKILFHVSDSADRLLPEDILNRYNLVFKREPYKDRSRYNLSTKNQQKIRATMLSCPFSFHSAHSFLKPLKNLLEPKPITELGYSEQSSGVFFSGIVSPNNDVREKVWEALVYSSGVSTFGGLQDRNRPPYKLVNDDNLKCDKLSKREYIEKIRKTKICLALDGWGEFTFRHLELWYMGAFMICSPNINYQELPLPVEEGKHYITYSSIDDLVEKVRYYNKHDKERIEIAKAGRDMFKDFYSTKKHGKYIYKQILKLLKNNV